MTIFLKNDGSDSAFYYQQLIKRSSTAFDVKYEELKARLLFPLLTDGPEFGHDGWVYPVWDQTGKAAVVADYADDPPTADAFMREYQSFYTPVASSVTMSALEMAKDRMAGVSLLAKKQDAAIRVVEQQIHRLALYGDAQRKVPGFLTNPTLSAALTATGNWGAIATDTVLDDLHRLANSVPEGSEGVETADTMLLPLEEFHHISTRRLADSERSIRDHFLEATPYIKNIDTLPELKTQDAAGTGPRVVVYRRTPDALGLSMPLNPTWQTPQVKNFVTVYPLLGACGGVVTFYPRSIARMDGMG